MKSIGFPLVGMMILLLATILPSAELAKAEGPVSTWIYIYGKVTPPDPDKFTFTIYDGDVGKKLASGEPIIFKNGRYVYVEGVDFANSYKINVTILKEGYVKYEKSFDKLRASNGKLILLGWNFELTRLKEDQTGRIDVIVRNETGKRLSWVTVRFIYHEGEVPYFKLLQRKTNEKGEAELDPAPFGKYWVEIETPPGYYVNETVCEVVGHHVESGPCCEVVVSNESRYPLVIFTLKPLKGKAIFCGYVKDAKGNLVKGAEVYARPVDYDKKKVQPRFSYASTNESGYYEITVDAAECGITYKLSAEYKTFFIKFRSESDKTYLVKPGDRVWVNFTFGGEVKHRTQPSEKPRERSRLDKVRSLLDNFTLSENKIKFNVQSLLEKTFERIRSGKIKPFFEKIKEGIESFFENVVSTIKTSLSSPTKLMERYRDWKEENGKEVSQEVEVSPADESDLGTTT